MSATPLKSHKRSYKDKYQTTRDRLMASQGREEVLSDLLACSVIDRDNLLQRFLPLPPAQSLAEPSTSTALVSPDQHLHNQFLASPSTQIFPNQMSLLSVPDDPPVPLPQEPLALPYFPIQPVFPIFPLFQPPTAIEIYSNAGDVPWKRFPITLPQTNSATTSKKPTKSSKQRKIVQDNLSDTILNIPLHLPKGTSLPDPCLTYTLPCSALYKNI